MQILIAAAGSWHRAPEKSLFDTYLERLPWKVELQEIICKPTCNTDKDRAAEAEKMTATLARFAPHHVIALDERGKNLSSRELAATFARWQDAGDSKVAILIGGHHGLEEALRTRADLLLSFGKLTWPHLLARAMLAEQLYRAQSIISGHPYHRD